MSERLVTADAAPNGSAALRRKDASHAATQRTNLGHADHLMVLLWLLAASAWLVGLLVLHVL